MRKKPKHEVRKILRDELHRKRGCEKKVKYLDEASARARANRDKSFFGKKRVKANGHHPYRCQFCGYWHIGTLSNPNFRADFDEITGKAYAIHKELPVHRPEWKSPRPDLSAFYERGLIRKENLQHGTYYLGSCKYAAVARWHAKERLFFYVTRRFGGEAEEGIPHPADDCGEDVFVPLDETNPTLNQRVYCAFGEPVPENQGHRPDPGGKR